MPLYFIAIVAPEEVNRQVLEWKRYMLHQFSCKKALRSPAHITLIPPFTMLAAQELPLAVVLSALAHEQLSFTVYLRDFSTFPSKVIFVQVERNAQLLQLKENLEEFLSRSNRLPLKKEKRPFHPHVTIASHDLKQRDFNPAWTYFGGRSYEAQFEVSAISLLTHTGGRWEIVADYPFGAAGGGSTNDICG